MFVCLADGVLRKKWKNLRDYFGTEYSKRPVARSGDGADSPTWTSKWKYFEQLLFLRDIIAPRKCSGPLSGIIDNDRAEDSQHAFRVVQSTSNSQNESQTIDHDEPEILNITGDTDSMMAVATSPTSTQLKSQTPPQATGGKKRKTASYNHYEQLLDIEKQKIELLSACGKSKQNDDDDDMLFLKSLHPFVKNVPMERKMAFRSKMQMLIDEFTYGAANNHNVTLNRSQQYGQSTSVFTLHSSEDRPYNPCPVVDTYQSYHTSNYNE